MSKNNKKSRRENVTESYENFESGIFRFFRSFSNLIDTFLFNQRYAVGVSLILAILMYFSVAYNNDALGFNNSLLYSRQINNVEVSAKYSNTTYELVGLPESCQITLTGDAGNVTSASNNKGYCLANLEGLVEGIHTVELEAIGYGDSVEKIVTPTEVTITLNKKTTGQFAIGYDFINTNKMDDVYVLGSPEFAASKVNVRASQDTLDKIAFVKALIDVSGVNEDFTTNAQLVAYDTSGEPVVADIVPSSIEVSVPVKSPSKVVPITLETTGVVPNDLAIESITMDHQTVTIYAPESVLSKVDQVTVSIDASTLNKDTKISQPIILPSGVTSSDITKVTLDVILGELTTKIESNVPINYKNNKDGLTFVADTAVTSVKVIGTVNNIDSITAKDIQVYFDMSTAVVGPQEFDLEIIQNTNPYIRYELIDPTISGLVEDNTVDGNDEGNG